MISKIKNTAKRTNGENISDNQEYFKIFNNWR